MITIDRYARQRTIAGVGDRGQQRIAAARVTIRGRELDAELAALYLAGAGVGELTVDRELADRCLALNSEIRIHTHEAGASSSGELPREPIELGSAHGSILDPLARRSRASSESSRPAGAVGANELAIATSAPAAGVERFSIHVGPASWAPSSSDHDPVARGSRGARWALARILSP